MLIEQEDFKIELLPDQDLVILTGTMRLNSPLAYEEYFSQIVTALTNKPSFTFDISNLEFLNSSGLTSLGRLFMQAKAKNISGKIIANTNIPWHQRSIVSICRLWPELQVEMK